MKPGNYCCIVKKEKETKIENNITEDCDITNFAISGIINVHSLFFFSEIVNRYLRILHKKNWLS